MLTGPFTLQQYFDGPYLKNPDHPLYDHELLQLAVAITQKVIPEEYWFSTLIAVHNTLITVQIENTRIAFSNSEIRIGKSFISGLSTNIGYENPDFLDYLKRIFQENLKEQNHLKKDYYVQGSFDIDG